MIALLQRVSEAAVSVEGRLVAEIGAGLLVLVGVERGDAEADAERMLERLLTYRVFPDEAGRMNRALRDTAGGLLLVSQFTLAADTDTGTRASFSSAAPPEAGRRLFDHLVSRARARHARVASGEYGAHMRVSLVNDGPVSFVLRVPPRGAAARAAPQSRQG
ncbi:MAG: D-aminoacyl-tRNA deacylase [Thiobacillaceae bacterium]|jgi:D-tyrosyl-tRNA(Tyr) deacylase|nr:D-aminoacyl-tRNA deacylase [Thiobacillaceae bacterium]